MDSDDCTVLDAMVASVMGHAIKNGDYARLNFFLERMIGKVPDRLDVKKVTSPTEMIGTALKTASLELRRLEFKSSSGETLTLEEQRALFNLSKTVIELNEEERKLKAGSDLTRMPDDELVKLGKKAIALLNGNEKAN